MTRNTYHVTRTKNRWAGKADGGKRASVTGTTKADVVKKTADLAKRSGQGQVVVHRMNGTIQSERTYGSDPFPPRG